MAADQSEAKISNLESRLKKVEGDKSVQDKLKDLDKRIGAIEDQLKDIGSNMKQVQTNQAKLHATTKGLPQMVKQVNEIKKAQA
jgi:DNA anti-recombination protein RmuC